MSRSALRSDTTEPGAQASAIPPLKPIPGRSDAERKARSRAKEREKIVGRYISDGWVPPQLGVPANSNIKTTVGTVPDPMDPKRRIAVTIHRGVDVLEIEHSHERIDPAEYHVGRLIQCALEEQAGMVGFGTTWELNDRVDVSTALNGRILRALEEAQDRTKFFAFVTGVIGSTGLEHLKAHMIDGLSFASVARAEGRPMNDKGGGAFGTRFVSTRFRGYLSSIARAMEARGPTPRPTRARVEMPVGANDNRVQETAQCA